MRCIVLFAILSILFSCSSSLDQKNLIHNQIDFNSSELAYDSLFIRKHANGNIKISGAILNSKREGKWTSYFENGTKQSEHNYQNGILNGNSVVFNPKGNVLYQGFYLEGKQHGKWIYYNSAGKKNKEIWFKNGKQI